MNQINTVLFDLDGTLLPMDTDRFMKVYFEEMGKYFADLIDPKHLVSAIWKSTNDMVSNLEHKTNETVFMTSFEKQIEGDLNIYKDRFYKFYDSAFHKAKEAVLENSIIRQAVDVLKAKGYTLVIATNPLFPYNAILTRVQWAGLNPKDFSLITNYENNHYCKPQIEFYNEILGDINKRPEECIMVGNDVQEDLIASKLGLQTYLIKDYVLHRTQELIKADYIGTYKDFYEFVTALPNV